MSLEQVDAVDANHQLAPALVLAGSSYVVLLQVRAIALSRPIIYTVFTRK